MKGKTRRNIKRFLGIPFGIVAGVFTIGGFIAFAFLQPLVNFIVPSLQPFPNWVWLTIFWFIILVTLVLISWILLSIYSKVLTREIKCFKEISFGEHDESTIKKAVDGILNTEKAKPFYVHAAPKSKEVETVYSRLKNTGFAMVSGGYGEGKSMLAYHTGYDFQKKDRYRIYILKTELLENKTGKEIIDEVLFQLDNLKGKRKLIIVDDAHKLAIKHDLNTILQQQAKEEHGKYIWVETEFYEGEKKEIQLCTIQVDFQSFLSDLQRDLYESQDPTLQETLRGRIEGLDDAIKRVEKGAIRDAWHFAFVASRGEERLKQEILYLNELEMQVLFLISAYTVLSGEAELSINYLLDKLNNLRFGWLTEALRKSTFSEAIKSLQEHKYEPKLNYERKSMIRIYDKNKSDRGYIASLHYNFARAVIGASLLRTNLAEDLLSSVKKLFTSEYFKCRYLGVFHHDIGSYAADFDRKNKNCLINFINNLSPVWLKCYPPLLRGIEKIAKDIYDEIIKSIDLCALVEKLNSAEVGQFQQIAYLLNAIGDHRDELLQGLNIEQLSKKASDAEVGQFGQIEALIIAIGDRRDELLQGLNIEQLSKKARDAEVGQFGQIEALIIAIGDRRDELLQELNIEQLSKKASDAEVGQFEQIEALIIAIGDRRDELLEKLDYNILVRKATQVDPSDIGALRGLTLFIAQLDEEHRDKFAKKVQWGSICKQCPIKTEYLPTIGAILENLVKQTELLLNTNTNDVAEHLRNHMDEVKKCIKETDFRQYRGLSKFLWNCNQINHQLTIEIMDEEIMNKLKERFRVCERVPPPVRKLVCYYRGVGELINSLYEIDSNLSKDFVNHNNVKGKIEQSINSHDWSEKKEDLKHLIKAFYKSAPELWKKMVNNKWLTADMSSLDLDSIYHDVDEKRNAGTAYNTA